MDEPAALEVDPASGVATITLRNRSTRNAIDGPMMEALGACLDRAAQPRILIVRGGPVAFSVGADLTMMAGPDDSGAPSGSVGEQLSRLLYRFWSFPAPTVAVVEGVALGGGLGLAAACDLVVASSRATFGLPEARLGLIPAVISPYVVEAIGARATKRLILTGATVRAEEAHRLGLVDVVAPRAELGAAVDSVVGQILAAGPRAAERAKVVVRQVAAEPITERQSRRLADEIDAVRLGPEAEEGLAAHRAKVDPSWLRSADSSDSDSSDSDSDSSDSGR
jgi:methylglutaconyl-CoA hydratase